MGRERTKSGTGERFLALPHKVMDCPAFIGLSSPATRLLLDLARQYAGTNNGKLLCTLSVMRKRGWTSNDTLIRARRELEAAGFIQQTRLPMMPRRAAWYGITWRSLDFDPVMDLKPCDFMTRAYLLTPEEIKTRHRLPVASSAG
ncbi:hypothetical protein U5817_06710 [Aromatoleum evansii]|uniref:Helix-turn-helix domain-containing protein n=1 Tax=Aromatoleum evansii TaxID=59406 RepID=A0ABZ1APD0_AROEV|nr:hypothetical protein U5817_06710 [Aromatoleum evansii]